MVFAEVVPSSNVIGGVGKANLTTEHRKLVIVSFLCFYLPRKSSMFKNWGAWLGTDKEVKEEKCSVGNDDQKHDVNKEPANVEEDVHPPQLLQKAKGLSGKSSTMHSKIGRSCFLNSGSARLNFAFTCFVEGPVKLY